MSQEYTPVGWQDETTSQQGTLINAERLNQMQTAHHYADGFEEVDEIPTEDPGTAYHKIVYCTEDSTFYRWDGTQWTADIDEETKHLLDQEIARAEHAEGLIQGYLDAHEANHSNPHQVTKAQVGLGNCDNTADLDKPISTAAQAALDTKADKATTLAGYGITDAYTKAQADTLLADKADKADVYDKTAADTLLAGKVDKLVSSPAGTYKSVTVNAQGQVTAGTNPDTLAGYGITDAYTKTEADTLLATKADTTALTDGSVTKVGTADLGTDTKPIKLVAGVPTAVTNDLVSTSGNQSIAGVKTFGSSPIIQGVRLVIDNASSKYVDFRDGSGTSISAIQATPGGVLNLAPGLASGGTKAVTIQGQRAYNAANTTDVATIATLDGYSPMVRTTGNQTINGHKIPEFKPNVKSYSVYSQNLNSKWVRVCYYPENGNFADMHCITRFISGHTTDTDFMFDVDIKQRCPNYTGNSALYLVNNACVRPLAIGKAPSGNEVGLVAIYRAIDGVNTIEIWGKFAGNRLIVTIENYHIINNLPAVALVTDDFTHDNAAPYITWDLTTFADELPAGILTQYLLKGKEST